MDDFDLEIKKEFINEALMNLEEVEGSFMELESSSDPIPLLDKIFRVAHNLKGGSRAVGFGDVAEFTHQLENLVQKIKKSEIALSGDIVTTLLKSNDRLVEMLSELKTNYEAKFDNTDLLQIIQQWLDGKVIGAPTVVEEKTQASDAQESAEVLASVVESPAVQMPAADAFFPAEAAPEPVVEINEVAMVEMPAIKKEEPTPEVQKPKPASSGSDVKTEKEDEVIRVNLSKIDLLNDFVGELIVLQSVIQQQASQSTSTPLHTSVRMMVKLSKDIQSLSMSLRMLPVKPLVQKLQRVVRDTARALNKEVNFDVAGDQLDIDKSVLDRLADPLIHILRNAVDHGLETPDARTAANKDKQGKVTLSFSNEGNHLVVEVKDDGKGINAEILRKKAIERKLISESQNLSEKQLVHLIFHPGFSTKAEASEISGRGVGMDVVKTNVEKIGGIVDVFTKVGSGSTFRMQIPLSLAVIEGLVLRSEYNRYVVPLGQVQETINLKSQKIFSSKIGIGSCFELRGTVVPLFDLDEVLGLKNVKTKTDGTALIVNVGDQLIALVVSDIIRAQQIVIKPLGNGIRSQKGWIGSCVLGDGLPTLIISPVDILEGRVQRSLVGQTTGGLHESA